MRFSGFQIVLQAAFMMLLAFFLGVTVNALSSNPLPIVRPKLDLSDPPAPATGPVSAPAAENIGATIELAEAHDLWRKGEALFLDARDGEDYTKGHIQGALSLPYDRFGDHFPGLMPMLTPTRPIVCYCGGADCKASIHLYEELKGMGFSHVRVFFGGWVAWTGAGYPTKAGEQP